MVWLIIDYLFENLLHNIYAINAIVMFAVINNL
jgi:hypothetical protein